MARSRFPDVAGILEAIGAEPNGSCMPDTETAPLPIIKPDHERKFLANGEDRPVGIRKLEFQAIMYRLCCLPGAPFQLIKSENFAGVDEMFELRESNADADVATYRLRFGSNRPCQLSMKTRRPGTGMEERLRTSIAISYRDLPGARAMLYQMAKSAFRSTHILIGQSGEFWFVKDTSSGYVVEIVIYVAGRAEHDAASPLKLLVEIAPRDCPNADVAVEVMQRCGKLLELDGRAVNESNMELFHDK